MVTGSPDESRETARVSAAASQADAEVDPREEALAALASGGRPPADLGQLEVVPGPDPPPAGDGQQQDDPPVWQDASPAPAGIPQKRLVVRTRPGLAPGAPVRRSAARPVPPTRRPVVGLPLLVLLSLLALFVAWVSAEPFWLAVGHHDTGAVEVTRCTGNGELGTRCVGTFSAQDRRYAVDLTTVSGASADDRKVGRTMPARMVSADGRIAYAGDTGGLHLRWLVGLALLLLIGLAIGLATGAWRLRGPARIGAVLTSLLTPLLLAAVALALTY
ncbi:MAG: hypothetical protein ACRDTM_03455 [Micromonosporaceae bacterium]